MHYLVIIHKDVITTLEFASKALAESAARVVSQAKLQNIFVIAKE